jgi:glyoxylase-like metal-dependent hydrolase (beta-lactamase superfamily II)
MIATTSYEDVLQINLCRYEEFIPGETVSACLMDGLLIDSGPAHTAEELAAFLNDRTLKIVVNTHFHEDHISANTFLQDRYGLEICTHPQAVDRINHPLTLYPYQKEVWEYPVPSQIRPLGKSIRTENFHFDVIPTPGHERDYICLFKPTRRWLFSGDLYVGSKPMFCRDMDDQRQFIEDLKTVRALKPRILFPAPTNVVVEPMDKLDRVIEHLEALGDEIEALHRSDMDITAIRQQIFGNESPIFHRTQHPFSSENMVKSFLRIH